MRPHSLTLAALLAQAPAGSVAIRDRGAAIAYGDLAARAACVAAGLARCGLGAGDRIAIWLPNVPAWLEILFAAGRLGAVALAVNTRFRAVEIADILHRSRARALVLWPGFRGIDFLGILEEIDLAALERLETIVVYDEGEALLSLSIGRRARRFVRYADLAAAPGEAPVFANPDAGAAIFTTSGTTKAPKFVLHSQRSLVAHARDVAAGFDYAAIDSVLLQALPFCGVFGLSQALATIAAGRPMMLAPTFEAEAAAQAIIAAGVTHTNGSDAMYRALLDARPEAVPFPTLRRAGFAAFNGEAEAFVAACDRRGLAVSGLYGMSEIQALFAAQSPAAAAAERARGG